MTVLVRCRDGAFYRNPLYVLTVGFVCFDEVERPELVLWLDPKNVDGPPPVDPADVLRQVFGYGEHVLQGARIESLVFNNRAQRVIPGSQPFQFAPATSFFFQVLSRPPRPPIHDGDVRYAHREAGAVLDWPAMPLDALFVEMGG